MRFIENHDNLRAAEVIEGRRSLLNWAIFYTLLPGATLVYAGQEIASPHRPDLFEKDPVDWEQGDYEFAQFMERALGLSKKIKGSCNQFSISELAEGVVKMVWRGDGPTYIALVNLAGKYGEVYLDELPENAVEICISRKGPVEAHARCLLSHMPMVFKISAPSRP